MWYIFLKSLDYNSGGFGILFCFCFFVLFGNKQVIHLLWSTFPVIATILFVCLQDIIAEGHSASQIISQVRDNYSIHCILPVYLGAQAVSAKTWRASTNTACGLQKIPFIPLKDRLTSRTIEVTRSRDIGEKPRLCLQRRFVRRPRSLIKGLLCSQVEKSTCFLQASTTKV